MYCTKCGKEVADESAFCPSCGVKLSVAPEQINSEVKTMKLRCKDCNGIMESDPNNQQLVCPFCGSKEMIVDSDAVAVEKIRSNTYKEVEYEKMKNENEKERRKESNEERESYKNSKFSKVTIAFTVICLLAMFTAFGSKHILAGLIALLQTGLFLSSWLMGMQIIIEKKKALHMAIAVLAFILIIPFTMASNIKKSEKLDWPTTGIATNIPKSAAKFGSIITNSDDSFFASLDKVSQSDYSKYVEKCKEMGYTVEANTDTYGYDAFNTEGYKLDISYYSSSEDMQISLDAPVEAKEFKWPNSEIAKLIPQPKSNVGKIEWEHDYGFVIYVANTTQDEFVAYAESCADAGFTVDYNKGDTYYYADNADGYYLNLEYEGNNTMFLRLDEPSDDEVTPATTDEPNEETVTIENKEESLEQASEINEEKPVDSSTSEELVNGMRPSFKDAMDEYEEFYVSYCDLLKKYGEDATDLTILTKYTDMMTKAIEVDKKFEAWDEDDLNDAELKYYTEVNYRVIKMMSEVN